MADPRDDRVSSAYREMPGEGPAPALDAAIQAAARRAVGSRPGGARRWQIPVSIAAVLALAVGISLQVDREKPVVADEAPVSSGSAEYPVPQAAPEKEEPPAIRAVPVPAEKKPANEAPRAPVTDPQPAPEAKRFAPDPPRAEPPAAAATTPSAVQAPAPPAAPPVAAGATSTAESARATPQAVMRAKSEAARDVGAQVKPLAEAPDPPERLLARIAELRAKGLHDEADRALAEFRRTYPGYRISDDWLRKVERR